MIAPGLTPDDIYLRAVTAQRARMVPTYITYRVAYAATGATITCPDGHIVVSFQGKEVSGSYRVSYRSADDTATSTDIATNASCSGAPLITPTGGDIAKLLDRTTAANAKSEPSFGATPIASVRVSGVFHYAVLAAIPETLEGLAVYHLTVRALTDPADYPLTDLFVDTNDFGIRRVVGSFVDRFGGAPAKIVATGDFVREGIYWVQTHEHVEFDARTEPSATHATLDARATDFAFPSERPASFR